MGTDFENVKTGTLAKLADLKRLKDEYKRRLKEEGSVILNDLIVGWFEACPEVAAIRWRQYTPHFNDGDPCLFRVGDVYFKFAPAAAHLLREGKLPGEEDGDYEDGFDGDQELYTYGPGFSKVFPSPEAELLYEKTDFLSTTLSASKDLLEVAFGDHVRITATAGKIEVEEYYHD